MNPATLNRFLCTSVLLLFSALAVPSSALAGEPPVNPNATPAAREVLQYLQSLEGKSWLAGQQEVEGNPARDSSRMLSITGKRPALRGFDNRGDVPDPSADIIGWWKEGGLSTISCHMGAPLSPDSYPNSKGRASLDKAMTRGTPENESFMGKLDLVAARLQKTQEAGVPVLWRPWHEMNGNWFWWSKDGPDEFKRLWIFMYDYYTKEKKLNNLLWVWSASFDPDGRWYPGDQYVDVTGSDVYMTQRPKADWAAIHQGLKKIAPSKPAALSENDLIPDPRVMKEKRMDFIWFLCWHSQWARKNPDDFLKQVYNDPYTITADKLPRFKTAGNAATSK